jgi:hypothetical protein
MRKVIVCTPSHSTATTPAKSTEHNVMVLELDGAFDRLLAAQAAACDDRGSTREVRSWSR